MSCAIPSADPLIEFLKINLHGTINLGIQCANAGVKRFSEESSIKVHGEQMSGMQAFTIADEDG